MLSLIAAACISLSSPAFVENPLPTVDIIPHAWGIEFVGSDGFSTDRDMIVVDPWAFDDAIDDAIDYAIEDPPTEGPDPDIWDCLDAARAACPNGVKRFYYSAGPPVVCEFECFPGTGGGS